jgi:threonylcarbamoyladenosine tRNA methylthiotransferase MtaB
VALHTLGCKVNQYETQKIAEEFLSKGFSVVEFSEEADVYVINSCTVTHTADSKSRQAARAASQRNPHAAVVLTGCYAETSREESSAIDGITRVIGNREKHILVDSIVELLQASGAAQDPQAVESSRLRVRGRTRALLKVQDGCDQFCTYCAVPLARSVMWSRPLKEVVSEASVLADNGYKEIVLTGIRVGRYEDEGANLTDLLAALSGVEGIERLRLSSIEVTDVPSGLLELIARDPKICRHLHVPLQSGDDEILVRMNRPYKSAQFESFVEKARTLVPEIAISTDIIVGFPGETESHFASTYAISERLKFSRSHVFRYSPRRGTPSAEFDGQVPPSDKERRSGRLIALGNKHAQEFGMRLVGQVVNVLVEGKEIGYKTRSGLTDNYIRVRFESDEKSIGKIVQVQVDDVTRDAVHGVIVE